MINQIKLFFDQHIALPSPGNQTEKNLPLACAVIFIEMMYMDDHVHSKESETILQSIINTFSLSTEEAETIISLAKQQRKEVTDYYQFTSLINKEFTQKQKTSLIKTLWEIAYADGELDQYEEYMVRKMADLLHVPHLEFIKAKTQVNRL